MSNVKIYSLKYKAMYFYFNLQCVHSVSIFVIPISRNFQLFLGICLTTMDSFPFFGIFKFTIIYIKYDKLNVFSLNRCIAK